MKINLFFALCFLGSIIFFAWYFLVSDQRAWFGAPNTPSSLIDPTDTGGTGGGGSAGGGGGTDGGVTKLPGAVQTTDGSVVSEEPYLMHEESAEVTTGFYEMTNNAALFGVFYDTESGAFTITLYGADTKAARAAAEAYILAELPYKKAEWCQFAVTVITNAYENPRYAGIDVGLSFCPGAATL